MLVVVQASTHYWNMYALMQLLNNEADNQTSPTLRTIINDKDFVTFSQSLKSFLLYVLNDKWWITHLINCATAILKTTHWETVKGENLLQQIIKVQ